mgnify:CR=1 FL=1
MQNKLTFFLSLLIFVSSLNISFAQNNEESISADTVFLNGSVYRVTDFDPWASSIAIKDGLIIHIGNDKDTRRFISSKTKIVDLNGKMLMPGFQDSHVHPVDSGMTYNQCAVFNLPILEDLLKAIKNSTFPENSVPLYIVDSFKMPHAFVIFKTTQVPHLVQFKRSGIESEDYLSCVYQELGL